jgi:hypothetical protein
MVGADYDDFMEERCSTASSLPSRLRSWITSLAAWSVGAWPLMRYLIPIGFTALVIAFASGCGRTVLVSEGSPIRIGPSAKARVYAMVDGEWQLSQNAVAIPEGWYVVSPSFVDK